MATSHLVTKAPKPNRRYYRHKEKLEAAAKELSDKIMPIGAKMYQEAAKEDSKSDDKKSNTI